MPPARRNVTVYLSLFAVSIITQLILYGRYIDNSIVNSLSPGSVDTADYVERAQSWSDVGFRSAFADAYRTPGYPAFLRIAQVFAGEHWLISARLAQVALIALLPIVGYLVVRRHTTRRIAISAGVAVAMFPPLSYFSTILMAESLTILTVSLLLLLGFDTFFRLGDTVRSVALGVLIGVAALLKPNNALLIVVALAMLSAKSRLSFGKRVVHAMIISSFMLLSVLPWALFASQSTGRIVPLSTTSGTNLLLGLGVDGVTGGGPISWFVERLDLEDPLARTRAESSASSSENAVLDTAYRKEALMIISARPLASLAFAAVEVVHAFGLLPGDPIEVVLGLIGLTSAAGAVMLWRMRVARELLAAYAGMIVVVALQAAVFLPNIRFRVSIFDLVAVCVLMTSTGVALHDRKARTLAQ